MRNELLFPNSASSSQSPVPCTRYDSQTTRSDSWKPQLTAAGLRHSRSPGRPGLCHVPFCPLTWGISSGGPWLPFSKPWEGQRPGWIQVLFPITLQLGSIRTPSPSMAVLTAVPWRSNPSWNCAQQGEAEVNRIIQKPSDKWRALLFKFSPIPTNCSAIVSAWLQADCSAEDPHHWLSSSRAIKIQILLKKNIDFSFVQESH